MPRPPGDSMNRSPASISSYPDNDSRPGSNQGYCAHPAIHGLGSLLVLPGQLTGNISPSADLLKGSCPVGSGVGQQREPLASWLGRALRRLSAQSLTHVGSLQSLSNRGRNKDTVRFLLLIQPEGPVSESPDIGAVLWAIPGLFRPSICMTAVVGTVTITAAARTSGHNNLQECPFRSLRK